jgi:PTS system nitrogen regulatory IIA component
MNDIQQGESLAVLIGRGGLYYDVPGDSPRNVLTALVERLAIQRNATPLSSINKDELLQAVLEREALMPTAMGNGIALPLPLNPLTPDPASQVVAVAWPKQPGDWDALDHKPVNVILLIVSATPKLHLATLSRLNFLCRDDRFQAMIKTQPPPAELLKAIEAAEAAWN